MSTLMSRDLNIERSSTRLHAPPGGKSSFSIGGDYEPVKKAAAPAPAPAPVAAVAAPAPAPVVAAAPAASTESVASVFSAATSSATAPATAAAGVPSSPAPKTQPAKAHRAQQSSMSGLLSQDSAASEPVRKVRQAPGGTSTFTLG